MAFQQPTRQAVQRPPREASEERDEQRVATAPAALEESQTWVLFSPAADTATSSSVLDSLPESSQQTAGRSRLSDLGSLQSLVRSNYASSYTPSAFARPANLHLSLLTSALSHANDEAVMSEDGRPDAEEDAELDSLDSHLPDFRPTSSHHQANAGQQQTSIPPHMTTTGTTTVNLPTHDGLGSFRLGETIGMGSAVQEHLFSFEQFNPRRVTKRRRESLDDAQLQADNEFTEDIERMRRIEAWRWEHSRVLLEEIQKETRRRRGSELSARRSRPGAATAAAGPAGVGAEESKQGDASGAWHEQEEEDERLLRLRKAAAAIGGEGGGGADGEADGESEGLWSRITRKFMLEVMGIDDRILSALFGEALVDEDEQANEDTDLSSTPKASNTLETPRAAAGTTDRDDDAARMRDDGSPSWKLRMLERIAKELGLFVHTHMHTHHPGAFSTFVRVQQMPLPYAGLPVIPEAIAASPLAGGGRRGDGVPSHAGRSAAADVAGSSTPMEATAATAATATTASLPPFQPTIFQAQAADGPGQAVAGEGAATGAGSAAQSTTAPSSAGPSGPQTFTQDEWEQDLDIKLVFRYLRSRFFSGPSGGAANTHGHRHHLGLSSGSMNMNLQEVAAKVARVRQHHPLVGRSAGGRAVPAYRSMGGSVASPSSPIAGLRHGHGVAATSCASQSTRRSARRSSMSSRHSSRHYWDIGGSIGTGSMIASAGPTGSWGEV